MTLVREHVKRCRIKSKRVSKEGTEVTVDVRLKQENTDFMHALCAMEGVANAVLVTYSGEYMT